MVPENRLIKGDYRLLETDNRICLPFGVQTRFIVTSIDVIHSLAIPSFGIKVDAIPGRLNQITVCPNVIGVYYGICSEICGANHALMPICVEVIPATNFISWANSFGK